MKKLHGVLACALAVGCGDDGAEQFVDPGPQPEAPRCEIGECESGYTCDLWAGCVYVGRACETPPPLREVVVPRAGQAPIRGSIGSADLDGNGWVDIASGTEDGVEIYFNDAGVFDRSAVVSLTRAPDEVSAGDIDGDGIGDLAVTSSTEGTDRTVSFIPGANDAVLAVTEDVLSGTIAFIGDIDSDGDGDLVAAEGGGFVSGGSFSDFVPFELATDLRVLGLDDFDDDGNLDLIGRSDNVLAIMYGAGDATFSPAVLAGTGSHGWWEVSPSSSRPIGAVCWDGGQPGYLVSLWAWNGNSFEEAKYYSLGLVTDMATADFDGDGALDFVASGQGQLSLSLASQQTKCEWRFPGGFPVQVVPDLDGDALPDIVSPTEDGIVVLLTNS